jgi:hypothetical protein
MVNPSPEDWSAWFIGEHRILLAVIDIPSGEIAFLWDGYSAIQVGGELAAVDYNSKGSLSISRIGAGRQIEGWVKIDP